MGGRTFAAKADTMRPFLTLLATLLAVAGVHAQTPPVEQLVPHVLNVYPHDPAAFTQGLLWHDGALYESTGLYGQSSLRRVDVETGAPTQLIPVDDHLFAEGLELVDGKLIQLTWKAGIALIYAAESMTQIDRLSYEGEGWGLCDDGRYLFMSDGSPFISVRDRDSFELIFRGAVTLQGQVIPPQLLNELECVGDHIYANAWNTDYIFRIDKFTGVIDALIDASALLNDAEKAGLSAGSVLNGIAWNPDNATFYITGKQWSKLFEVVFVEA